MEKIYITGTGRCGTTFLMKLFTFLNFDTGYTKFNYNKGIVENCNAGMENVYYSKPSIIKSPGMIELFPDIVQHPDIIIKAVIIPIRDYKMAAISRVNHKNQGGGLWNAIDEETQTSFYHKIIANYVYYMTKYDINTIFIDFDRMISDKSYLFNKLSFILSEKNISFDMFSLIYDEVAETCKPKKFI